MAAPKLPLYVLPHGIEVIGEYPARGKNLYWRLRIRPHPFFPDAKVVSNGCYVRRNRVVLASQLGRALTAEEIAHHDDEDRENDAPGNLKLSTHAEHNRHHKVGTKHSEEAKSRISAGLTLAIAEGRRLPPPLFDWNGKQHRAESKEKISETRKALIASGAIAKPTPPSGKGRVISEATRERMRQARLDYWKTKKGN